MSPKMTKKHAIEIALSPDEFSAAELRSARERLEESLTKGTPGGFGEHMYVQDRAKDLDRAIAAREGSPADDERSV